MHYRVNLIPVSIDLMWSVFFLMFLFFCVDKYMGFIIQAIGTFQALWPREPLYT